ncbi:YlbD family protein [Virgibacillus sp. NKC19-16]|uniref:YlbD family protein n=1 Tax=Virgibacillus salidurans TaxID=2831673 RepID=UPI001F1CEF2D|nr:YlbD family protein [Virgibacillus sp. NKC19-16]UJL47830.1 YlbD family protein [Virgibacillus sp. NKC19-16]
MSGDKLHPTVLEFKQFMNKHPVLLEEVRKNGRSWQEYYEKWVLLGEDDPFWGQYRNKDDKTDEKGEQKHAEIFRQLMKLTKNMDLDKVQEQVHQLNNTISMIQGGINQFQENKKSSDKPKELFNLFRD